MVVGLTMERSALYERIDARIDAQMAAGWLDEVRGLRELGYGLEHAALSGLGYGELMRHLDGEMALDEAVQRIKYTYAQSLSFSMQANPRIYALLLGSGVSRPAEIPTGWEIVVDLLGKLAASMGEEGVTDVEEWYFEKYQEFPDYSKMLDALARKPGERQQLLRPYFEPSDEQRREGVNSPKNVRLTSE
ncbi:tRNA dimethylallyltransferase [Geodia barretti]|uniref:tRNA dimethylallyltransferase n=1 Tax=Geodia barretti TaxID=519541 RepID=A0AA35QUL8_GEOBA|nr:tRNA dimethylallyltransferase [Geodia barretti]